MNSRLKNIEKKILLLYRGTKIECLFRTIILTNKSLWKVILPGQKPNETLPVIPTPRRANSYKNADNQTVIICEVLFSRKHKVSGSSKRKIIRNHAEKQRKHFEKLKIKQTY